MLLLYLSRMSSSAMMSGSEGSSLTSKSSSPATTSSSPTSAAAQVASLYLQHQQKQYLAASTKSDAASDWSRRLTFTTAATSQQTYSTPSVSSASRYATSASERDDGLYSMSSVSVDLGESAARSKHHQHHAFSKPDPRQGQAPPPRSQTYERAGKYSAGFDHLRVPSGSKDYVGKR